MISKILPVIFFLWSSLLPAADFDAIKLVQKVEAGKTHKLPLKFNYHEKKDYLTLLLQFMSEDVRLDKLQSQLLSLKIDTKGCGGLTLPSGIGQFTALQKLNLKAYLKSLPDDVFRLKNLKKLNLSRNNLKDLSDEIKNLVNLDELLLEGNNLESLPAGLGALKNLRELNLERNKLSSLPEDFYDLENLTSLNVRSNHFLTLPPELTKLKGLMEFHFFNEHASVKMKYLTPEFKIFLSQLLPNKSDREQITPLIQDKPYALGPSVTSDIDNIAAAKSKKLTYWDCQLSDQELNELVRYMKDEPDRWANVRKNLNELTIFSNNISSLPSDLLELENLETLSLTSIYQLTSMPPIDNHWPRLHKLDIGGSYHKDFPEEILKLTSLQNLRASCCRLNSFPENLSHLSKLETLDLSLNSINEFPEAIGELTSLNHLDLSYNAYKSLPSSLWKLTNLQFLNLYSSVSCLEIPQEVGQLVKLKKLKLPSSPRSLPKEMASLTNLEELEFTSYHMTSLPSALIPLFTSLKLYEQDRYYYLFHPTPFGLSIDIYKQLSQIENNLSEVLDLNHLLTTEKDVENIFAYMKDDLNRWENIKKNIKKLVLSNNKLKLLPKEFLELENLEVLDLSHNKLTEIPDFAGKLEKLVELNASHNALNSTSGLEALKLLGKLTHLNLAHNKLLPLPTLLWELSQLKSLNLRHTMCEQISPEINNLKELESLDISDNKLKTLPREIGTLTALKSLNLYENNQLVLPSELVNLKQLDKKGFKLPNSLFYKISIDRKLKKLFVQTGKYTDYRALFSYEPRDHKALILAPRYTQCDQNDGEDFLKLILWQNEYLRYKNTDGFLNFAAEQRKKLFPDAPIAADQFVTILSKSSSKEHAIDYIKYSLELPEHNGPRPVAIYAHGGGAKNRKGALDIVALHHYLINKGWIVVVVNFTEHNEPQDIYDVAMHFWSGADPEADPKKIILTGISRGSKSNAELMALIGSGTNKEMSVNPFVAVHFSSMHTEPSFPSMVKDFPDIPYLFTHGQLDNEAPVQMVQEICSKMAERGLIHRFIVSPTGDHHIFNKELSLETSPTDSNYINLLSYTNAVASFFNKVATTTMKSDISSTAYLLLKKLAAEAMEALFEDDLESYSNEKLLDIIENTPSFSQKYLDLFLDEDELHGDFWQRLTSYFEKLITINDQEKELAPFLQRINNDWHIKRDVLKVVAREAIVLKNRAKIISHHAVPSGVFAMYAFYSIVHGIAGGRSVGIDSLRGDNLNEKYLGAGGGPPITRQVKSWEKKRADQHFNQEKKYGDQTFSQAPVIFAGNDHNTIPLYFWIMGNVGKFGFSKERVRLEVSKALSKIGLLDTRHQRYIDLLLSYSKSPEGHGLIQFFPEPKLYDQVSNLAQPLGIPFRNTDTPTPSKFLQALWDNPGQLKQQFSKTPFANPLSWSMFNKGDNRHTDLLFSAVQFRTLADPRVTLFIPKYFYPKNRPLFNLLVETLVRYLLEDLHADYIKRRDLMNHFDYHLLGLQNLERILEKL